MGRLRIAGLTAVLAACLATAAGAQGPWREVRGGGFSLRTQLPLEKLSPVACDLETAVRVLRRSPAASGGPQVVAVNDSRGIREWLPQFEGQRANPLGAYWSGLYGHHIVVRVDAPPDERLRRVLHEYAHYTTHLVHPEPPRWLDEGLSELWEHVVIARDTITVGGRVPAHVKRLESGKDWMPIRDLVAANAVPTGNSSVTAMFYAQSWALVHYLMRDRRGGQIGLDELPSAAELPTDEVLQAYVRGPMAPVVQIATREGPAPCASARPIHVLSPLESLKNRARALADGDRPDAALPLVRQALLLDADDTESLEALGFIHFTGNRHQDAAGIFDRLIASGQATFISFYYRAVLAGPVPERANGAGPVPQVEYLRKALALNPAFAPALERLKELSGKGLGLALDPSSVRE